MKNKLFIVSIIIFIFIILCGISFAADLYAAGDDNAGTGLISSYDGSWNSIPSPGFYTVNDIYVGAVNVIATGDDNAGTGLISILYENWESESSLGFYTVNSVAFDDVNYWLYAGGDDNAGTGLIAKSDGNSWTTLPSPGFYTVNSVYVSPECGNNYIEIGETCDGTDLDDKTCSDFGYDTGSLSCLSDCSDFDTNGCSDDEVPPIGGGGGSSCVPEWDCTEWGECQVDGYQYRTCTDIGLCHMTYNKPDEMQICEEEPEERGPSGRGCSVRADCGANEVCTNGICGISSCSSRDDCPDDMICRYGLCAEAGCFYDTDCPEGEVCVDNLCETPKKVMEKLLPFVPEEFIKNRWNLLWLILLIAGILAIVLYMILHHTHMPEPRLKVKRVVKRGPRKKKIKRRVKHRKKVVPRGRGPNAPKSPF